MSSIKQLSLRRVLDLQQKLIEEMRDDPRLDVVIVPVSKVKHQPATSETLCVSLIEHLVQVRVENVHIVVGVSIDGTMVKLNPGGSLSTFTYDRLLGVISGMVDAVDIRASNRQARGSGR